MPAEVGTETVDAMKEILLDAAEAVRMADDYLSKAGEATYGYEPEIVKQIRVERKSLDALLKQLMQARTITDDALFTKTAGALKLQIPSLRAVSDRIKEIASDVDTAPGIGGYMEQTVTSIAQAAAFIAELP